MCYSSVFHGGNAISPLMDMHTNEIISYDLSLHPNLDQPHRTPDRGFCEVSKCPRACFSLESGLAISTLFVSVYAKNTDSSNQCPEKGTVMILHHGDVLRTIEEYNLLRSREGVSFLRSFRKLHLRLYRLLQQ